MDFDNKEKEISWEEAEAKLKKAFDFSAFLGDEELDDRVTDVTDGKDLLEPDAFERFAPDYIPRRTGDGERGRHEAPGQEPLEFIQEEPAEPEKPAMDPADPRYAAPERPRVMVAGASRPTVYVTPEGDFDGPDNFGGGEPPAGNGAGRSWVLAAVIALAVVAVVLGLILALLAGGGSGDAPKTDDPTTLLVTPSAAADGSLSTSTPAPTEKAEATPAPTPTEKPEETFTILVTAGTGGDISPSGSVSVKKGESITFTLSPDDGYDVSQLIIDGDSIAPTRSYTFKNVKDDHTIYAVFVKLATPAPTEPPATPTPEPTAEPTPEPTEPPASVPEEPAEPEPEDMPAGDPE